ncbi:MAG: Gfo/Idh/MocA family oxidoreductase [Arsenophonus endosymbiont of Dermacentor nuttalli]
MLFQHQIKYFPLAKQALEAGKHVIADNSFTLTVEEAVTLKQLAQAKGKLLSVYHNRRWDSGFLTVKSLLEKQTLGELKYYESHFDRYRPEESDNTDEGQKRQEVVYGMI